jgi:pilN
MIEFIKVNLLPYREMARLAKKKDLRNFLFAAMAFAVLLNFLLYYVFSLINHHQEKRIAKVQNYITSLDDDLNNYKQLYKEKKLLINERIMLLALQNNRYIVPRVLNELDTIVPKGVQLIKIEQAASNHGEDNPFVYEIYGQAISDSRVALFLDRLSTSDMFDSKPVMNEIVTVNGLQHFKITTQIAASAVQVSTDESSDDERNKSDHSDRKAD